ncbi:MAG TPA: polysaccharide deacetylase family protein [Candidatus Acidoferrales bacterium]|nr:polysaccharide deacetylase family protein [Candidatus Acidoferrales bacterium]
MNDPLFSLAALRYAVRELGRRAGADAGWIASWQLEVRPDRVAIAVEPDNPARVVIPHQPRTAAQLTLASERAPARFDWPPGTAVAGTQDFVVPFESDGEPQRRPIYSLESPALARFQADLLTPALWMLSRVEETMSPASDEHGRFPAAASMAGRFGFLDRPIVDEYALALRQALSALVPSRALAPLRFRAKLSHDIDEPGVPGRLRTTIGHLYPRRLPGAFARDLAAAAGLTEPAYLRAVTALARTSRERSLDSAFYWQAAKPSRWEAGYPLDDPRIRAVLRRLIGEGFEVGIHPSYAAYESQALLEAEVQALRGVAGDGPMGGRQHYLRWRPPTWRAWERAGLAYDSSVGFADAIGFRAGTAVPYHPWLCQEDRESGLLEIPLIVMDVTPVQYMSLAPGAVVGAVAEVVGRCRAVGGVFTLLWHNDRTVCRPYSGLYPRILDLLEPCERYDWESDRAIAPLPQARASL